MLFRWLGILNIGHILDFKVGRNRNCQGLERQ